MKINNLNKEELLSLKQRIENKLKNIEYKESEIKSKTFLSLKNGDKIFGIRLYFDGHRLTEPKDINGIVDIIDYCNVESINTHDNSDFISINISHPTKPFGVITTLDKKTYENKYYYLFVSTMKSGYDSFYTLKPENWKEDLIKAFNENIESRKKYFQKDLDIIENKLQLFINSEEKINEVII